MGFDKKEKKNIEELEIKVYQLNETKMGQTRLRLVCWVIDGKKTAPMFEKRAFVLREIRGEQKLQMSKAKGMTESDLMFVKENMDAIVADIHAFVAAGKEAEVATAQNKDWNFQEEEKVAEEMFS